MPKTIFIDSTADIDRLWREVHGTGDPPITVNQAPVAEADIPKSIAGFDTVINDATYFTKDTMSKCTGLKHIVFLGTGAGSLLP